MLPLDGGHVAIAVYEKIRTGRRTVLYHADVAKLMPFTWLFMLFLAVLIVPALLTDILHPDGQPLRLVDGRRARDRREDRRPAAGSMGAWDPRPGARPSGGPPGRSTWATWPSGAAPRHRPVDDDDQDGRRRRDPGPDLRPGRRRGRHRPLHLQRGGRRRGPGPDRPPVPVPIIADIHFHVEMALAALEAGVQGLRLNPGNLRKAHEIKLVAAEAKDRGVPIRIGVNAGSLHPDLYKKYGGATPEALVESARMELAYFAEVDFEDVKISVKASSVPLMIESYRLASETFDHPLHLGVTEAGPPPAGLIKGTAGIATLLAEGIGDTIRYSLTADPVEEARAGRQLLEALGLRERKGSI